MALREHALAQSKSPKMSRVQLVILGLAIWGALVPEHGAAWLLHEFEQILRLLQGLLR